MDKMDGYLEKYQFYKRCNFNILKIKNVYRSILLFKVTNEN